MNIKGGTVNFSNRSLCETCRSSHIIRGITEKQQIIMCNEHSGLQVLFKVVECTEYADKNKPDLYEMKKMAHILVQKGDKVGFVPNEKYREQKGLKGYEDLDD